MSGVLIVGSINHDSIYNVKHLPMPHETVPAGGFKTAPGGKGANQAAACALATTRPVHLLGCVGKDIHADMCLSYLEECNVDISRVLKLEDRPTGTACIMVAENGDNLIVVSAGANGALMPTHVEAAREAFENSAIVLTQLEVALETVRQSLVLARALGKTSILNPAPYVEGVENLVSLADIFTPNQTEAASLTGLDVKDEISARDAVTAILKLGAGSAIITLGGEGSLVATQTETRYVPAYRVDHVVDTSGAGDVYNGALAGALVDGANLTEAADFASAAAAMSVQKPTASYCAPRREEALAFQKIAKEI